MTFRLSQRDNDRLDQIHEDLARVVRRAAEITKQPFCVTCGLRTLEEQKRLYAQGRTAPGKIVTWTMNSQHLSGRAVDLAAIAGTKILWDEKLYPIIAEAMLHAATELHIPIEWGGFFKIKKDLPHFEMRRLGNDKK